MNEQRQIIFHKEYFVRFYSAQSKNVQEKIDYVFTLLRTVDRVPRKFLDHLEGTDELYEIRVEYSRNIYRIFCCFDKGNLIVLFNSFQKKTQKTPNQELELAERLKKEYFSSKKK